MPKVSILMPVHNCEKTIRRSLDSIYAQTFKDFELIVVLNNCTDKSEEIVREYDNRFSQPVKIEYCRVPGIVPTLNTGIPSCTGPLVARMDGDDKWYDTKLEKQVQYLDDHSDIDILGTQLRLVDRNGDTLEGASLVHPVDDISIKQKLFSGQNSIVHPSVVFRKHIFLCAGTYDGHYKFAEDYHFWMKC